MADLPVIVETLRRQRKDLDELMEDTASRTGKAADLLSRIEDLRRRSEETLRRFPSSTDEYPREKSR